MMRHRAHVRCTDRAGRCQVVVYLSDHEDLEVCECGSIVAYINRRGYRETRTAFADLDPATIRYLLTVMAGRYLHMGRMMQRITESASEPTKPLHRTA